ncbi:MAG: hypothetical protein SOV43_09710 [Selenomonadaceae bacterium]|nr:hypothetical protein [Selenomonadaceae bacterium]
MVYPFMTYIDGTEITYTDIFHQPGDSRDFIKVYFERVNEDGTDFDSMDCILPGGEMEHIVGFTETEVRHHHDKIVKMTPILLACAREEVQKSA